MCLGRVEAKGYSIEWPKVLLVMVGTTPGKVGLHPVINGDTVPYNTLDSTPTV